MDSQKLNSYAKSFIEIKARQLVGKCGIRKSDVQDIAQDLFLNLLERFPKYNPAKGKYSTFIQRITERKISKILRDRRAEKRIVFLMSQSLDELVSSEDSDEEVTSGRGIVDPRMLSPDFLADFWMIVRSLPPVHQKVCRMLMAGFTTSIIADTLDLPRTTARDSILCDIRNAFGDYKFFYEASPKSGISG